jgi:hypothetical protein
LSQERYYIRATRVATLEQAGEAAFRQGAVLPFKARIAQALLRMGEEAARGDEGAAAVAGMAFRALSQVDPDGAEEVGQEWEKRGVDVEQARAWGLGCVDAEVRVWVCACVCVWIRMWRGCRRSKLLCSTRAYLRLAVDVRAVLCQ